MRFFASVSAILAVATSAFAQTADFDPIYTPEKGEVVPAGSTYKITWKAPAKYADGTVTISLIGGADPNSLVPLKDIASGIANSDEKYEWNVDPSLGGEATYGLAMKLEPDLDVFQYSNPFKINKGGNGNGNGGDSGKPTTTITTSTGKKTVTLTSCTPTTTSSIITSTFSPNTTTSTWSTTTQQWNTTSLVTTPVPPPVTTNPPAPTDEPAPTSPEPTVVPTTTPGAGAHVVAGPVALIGGLAMAFLAM